jgi:hypothetical protein
MGDCLLWAVFSITIVDQIFGLLLSTNKTCMLIFTKSELGYILGDFFTNSSGHPEIEASFSTNEFANSR